MHGSETSNRPCIPVDWAPKSVDFDLSGPLWSTRTHNLNPRSRLKRSPMRRLPLDILNPTLLPYNHDHLPPRLARGTALAEVACPTQHLMGHSTVKCRHRHRRRIGTRIESESDTTSPNSLYHLMKHLITIERILFHLSTLLCDLLINPCLPSNTMSPDQRRHPTSPAILSNLSEANLPLTARPCPPQRTTTRRTNRTLCKSQTSSRRLTRTLKVTLAQAVSGHHTRARGDGAWEKYR